MKSLRLWERRVTMAVLLALSTASVAMGEGGEGGEDPGDGSECTAGVDWEPYGFANPGDPVYGFELPDPSTQTLVGFAAKGNVIIGDYLSPEFQNETLPALDEVKHAYLVDSTDEALGYRYTDGDNPDWCGGRSPCFNGDYNRQDKDGETPGRKLDGSPRKFYESTLSDEAFAALITAAAEDDDDPLYDSSVYAYATIDGVFFTNHAFAGRVLANGLSMFGSIVARDDGLIRGPWFDLSHDMRLYNELPPGVVMPRDFGRPKLVRWQECTPTTPCSPLP